ncbi:MAG: hypothetical protein AB1734_02380 [Elusimicrobiota bacterium]|jgi:hypothetical protein
MVKTSLFLAFLLGSLPPAAAAEFTLDRVSAAEVAAVETELPAPAHFLSPLRTADMSDAGYFNRYILKAVDRLYAEYGLLGYDINSILTHDIPYHTYGVIKARRPPLTMCVAAMMEVLLTAYDIYAAETGDYSVFTYLPQRSYERLAVTDIKGHIWVNHEFKAYGTADALINFGMGERRLFERLRPGDFVNINRTTRTGHAVVFLNYIDVKGRIQPSYNDSVVGFKYFSSQGGRAAGTGGFDYRYAVFSKFGCPEMPYKRDCDVIYSQRQDYLNTGTMWMPERWTGVFPSPGPAALKETVLNARFFDGRTTDD